MTFTDGLHCKACDCTISDFQRDTELCGTCLAVVYDLIKDIEEVNMDKYAGMSEAQAFLEEQLALLESEDKDV